MKNKIFTLSILLSASILSSTAFAQKGFLTTKVRRVLVDDTHYGKCMAEADRRIDSASNSLNCPSNWVTFSCDGTYNSKDIAYRKLDMAQKSEATQSNITFYVDDTKKHNGYCYAYRVDSLR